MRRGELGGRIFYVENRWRLSFACFVLALLWVGIPAAVLSRQEQRKNFGMLMGCAVNALGLAVLVRKQRLVTIDPARGTLVISERYLIGRTHRLERPLRGLRVRTSSAGRSIYIWLEAPSQGRILFLGNLVDWDEVHDRVAQLSLDIRPSQEP